MRYLWLLLLVVGCNNRQSEPQTLTIPTVDVVSGASKAEPTPEQKFDNCWMDKKATCMTDNDCGLLTQCSNKCEMRARSSCLETLGGVDANLHETIQNELNECYRQVNPKSKTRSLDRMECRASIADRHPGVRIDWNRY